jgi:lysozyme
MAITSLEEQLIRDEDKKGSVYKDSLGYWTVGIGTCIDSAKGCALTDDEMLFLLRNRLKLNADALSQAMPWTDALDDVRRGALLNMVYQMGLHGVAQFKNMLTALQQGDYAMAAAEGRDSEWFRKQSPARAERLMQQIEQGIWL